LAAFEKLNTVEKLAAFEKLNTVENFATV